MHPFKKRIKVGITHDFNLDDKQGFDLSVLKGDDAYFGAVSVSSDTLFEEFGFVPAVSLPFQSEDITTPQEEHYKGVIIHENEYDEYQRQYHCDTSTLDGRLLRPDYELEVGVPLKDITNQATIPIPLSQGEPNEKSSITIMGIDQSLSIELENALRSTTTMILPVKSKDFNRPLFELSTVHEQLQSLPKSTPIGETDIMKDVEVRKKRFPEDLYTPRWVRGKGLHREGFCELCHPGLWLKIKQSAYWYHMNFVHGVSANTGRPYDSPLGLRQRYCHRINGEEIQQLEGKCGSCHQWIVLQHIPMSSSPHETDYSNATWWRHAQKCISNQKEKCSSVLKKRLGGGGGGGYGRPLR